ncbi:MAG: DinB family protein [Planctomycetota bacterium]
MSTIGPMIADSAQLTLGYAQRLLNGVTPEQFARFARIGDQVIESNHPAFILGHLSLYPCRIVDELGGDASAITPTEPYENLFSHETTCVDDSDGSIYPAMDEVVNKFTSAYETTIDFVKTASDEAFAVENPNERMRAKFATKGSMHAFYMSGHGMIHMGQFSAWRRVMGLGSA